MTTERSNPFAAPQTNAAVEEDAGEPAHFSFVAERVRRVVWFFAIMYAATGLLSLTQGGDAAIGSAVIVVIQGALGVVARRRPRGAMLGTAWLFGTLLLLSLLVSGPLGLVGFGNILGVVLTVFGIKEVRRLRQR